MSNFERRMTEVEAVRLKEAVYDAKGGRLADIGEWLLTDNFGQYYMRDVDFQREFVKKGPKVNTVIQKEVVRVPAPPIIIREPCPDHWGWPRPWWEQGVVWCSSQGYTTTHAIVKT